jgi:hypothetical protein
MYLVYFGWVKHLQKQLTTPDTHVSYHDQLRKVLVIRGNRIRCRGPGSGFKNRKVCRHLSADHHRRG